MLLDTHKVDKIFCIYPKDWLKARYRQTLRRIFDFTEPEAPILTVEMICYLHAQLMQTSRVLYIDLGSRHKISHINIGTTRQVSQVNVTATTASTGRRMKVQFCPYDEIDSELHTFCERFNVSVKMPNLFLSLISIK